VVARKGFVHVVHPHVLCERLFLLRFKPALIARVCRKFPSRSQTEDGACGAQHPARWVHRVHARGIMGRGRRRHQHVPRCSRHRGYAATRRLESTVHSPAVH
jgi:hypothetical protein